MRKKENPAQPTPEADPGVVRLEDLDQHIAERITQLGEPFDAQMRPEPEVVAIETDSGEERPNRFSSGFEPFDVFDYTDDPREENMRSSYREVSQNYQETAELLKNIHDLADLVTESIRQLSIRLNIMDEHIESVAEERATELDKSIRELRLAMREQQRLLKETYDRLNPQTTDQQPDKAISQILMDLEKHASFLDSRIERGSADLKHKLEEHRESLLVQFNSKVNALEKESRDYLNRSLFSLAVLVVVITFIAGALIVNTMDRVCNYLTQSVDTLRAHMDQVNGTRTGGLEH